MSWNPGDCIIEIPRINLQNQGANKQSLLVGIFRIKVLWMLHCWSLTFVQTPIIYLMKLIRFGDYYEQANNAQNSENLHHPSSPDDCNCN